MGEVKHQAQKMYPGRALYDFHAGNSQTGFQADGFQVIVDRHVIAECEDSECADFIAKAWNYDFDHAAALAERDAESERLKRALIDIRHGVFLMVPEPQQSAFVKIIDAALARPTEEEKTR